MTTIRFPFFVLFLIHAVCHLTLYHNKELRIIYVYKESAAQFDFGT